MREFPDASSVGHGQVFLLLGRLEGGGTEAHAAWLSRALSDAGVPARLHALFPQCGASGAFRAAREGLVLWPSFRSFLRLCARERPRAIFCFGRVANGLGYRIKARFPEIPLVATCRTSRSLPPAYRRSLTQSDQVLANSQWAAARVCALPGVWPGRVRMIPNALMRPELLRLEHSPATRSHARRALGLGEASPVLTALAHFVPGKNQEALIRLLGRGAFPPGSGLLLVGEGPRRRACERLARRLGLASAVHFTGRVDSLDLVLQASDLVVSTSLRDSLPNALVEAQAAALPVVAFDTAGVGEAFLPGESGVLVPPGEPEALAAAVCQLWEDAARRARFAKVAREQAARRFEAAPTLNQYQEITRRWFP